MIKNSIKHLAIIMDGNGRWAKKKNHPRGFGHERELKPQKQSSTTVLKRKYHI